MRLHRLSDNRTQLNANEQSVLPTKENVNPYSVIEVS